MDTLTHAVSGALLGRALASTPIAQRTGLTPGRALALGALAGAFPDSDFLLRYVSDLAYLRGHRGVTHSIILLPLWAALLASLFTRIVPRGRAVPLHWGGAFAVAAAGILIHIAGDLITQFGTMILAPFSDQRFGWGTTFIIDLVLSGMLLAGLIASLVWRRSRIPAVLALAGTVVWVGVGATGRSEAIAAGRAHAAAQGIPVVAVDAAPRPASPFNWTAIVFDGERYHYAHINTRRSAPLVVGEDANFVQRFSAPYMPVHMAEWKTVPRFGPQDVQAMARSVWAADDFAFFRWFAMFPVLDHVEKAEDGTLCAGFRDLRFETPGRGTLPFRFGLCAGPADGIADSGRLYELIEEGRRWLQVR